MRLRARGLSVSSPIVLLLLLLPVAGRGEGRREERGPRGAVLSRAWAFGEERGSYKGRLVDALGQSADEGRDQRRNAQGSCKEA